MTARRAGRRLGPAHIPQAGARLLGTPTLNFGNSPRGLFRSRAHSGARAGQWSSCGPAGAAREEHAWAPASPGLSRPPQAPAPSAGRQRDSQAAGGETTSFSRGVGKPPFEQSSTFLPLNKFKSPQLPPEEKSCRYILLNQVELPENYHIGM